MDAIALARKYLRRFDFRLVEASRFAPWLLVRRGQVRPDRWLQIYIRLPLVGRQLLLWWQ